MSVHPSDSAGDVVKALAERIDLNSVDGWALYEVSTLNRSMHPLAFNASPCR